MVCIIHALTALSGFLQTALSGFLQTALSNFLQTALRGLFDRADAPMIRPWLHLRGPVLPCAPKFEGAW